MLLRILSSLWLGKQLAICIQLCVYLKCTHVPSKKTYTLAMAMSVVVEWHHVTPTLSLYFFYTLETESMCTVRRVSPE